MLVESITVETSITNSKAGKLPCISINVSAALDARIYKTKLQKLLIEIASVPAEVAN